MPAEYICFLKGMPLFHAGSKKYVCYYQNLQVEAIFKCLQNYHITARGLAFSVLDISVNWFCGNIKS